MRKYYQDSLRLMILLVESYILIGGNVGGRLVRGGAVGGGWGEVGARRGYHIKFPCYIRHLYGHSIGIHVPDFKWKSVN